MKFHKKRILENASFRSITFSVFNRKCMLANGWSLSKGDWWYEETPDDKKFFSVSKEDREDTKQYGIYIGRLSLIFMINKGE